MIVQKVLCVYKLLFDQVKCAVVQNYKECKNHFIITHENVTMINSKYTLILMNVYITLFFVFIFLVFIFIFFSSCLSIYIFLPSLTASYSSIISIIFSSLKQLDL